MPDREDPSYPERSTLYGDTHDQLLQGHSYDGIKEYDNPMPGWWIWIFWASVAFSVVYFVGITWFDFVDTYEDDLAEGQQELQAMRTAYAEANPTFEPTPAALADYVGDNAAIQAGAETYASVCASCHGDNGGGLIGPNLTDQYWIHGGSNVDIFNILTDGVPAKGMPAWDSQLSPEKRAELVAFIRSLQGTDPPNAKEPEGELVE
jgi:cytochrome c oxidase cbb3-type subunit 3